MKNEEIVKELNTIRELVDFGRYSPAIHNIRILVEKLQPKPLFVPGPDNCDWCGKGGKLVVKHYHKKCHEAILNGEGV